MPTVLIVEDDGATQSLLTAILGRFAFHIVTARDGAEALSAIERFAPDVVLLDVMLPRVSGLTVLERLAARKPVRKNVIVLSAVHPMQLAGMDMTAVSVMLQKPFDLDVLLEAVRTVSAAAQRQTFYGGAIDDQSPDRPTK